MRGIFLILLVLVGCSQKSVRDESALVSVSGKKRSAPRDKGEKLTPIVELRSAYFDYDLADIRSDARATIRENAEWLKKNPEANVEIEGHCDERGTREYNYRLGQDRADNAKAELIKHGISSKRITTVSYGAIDGQSEKSWPKHRKAVFVIIYSR